MTILYKYDKRTKRIVWSTTTHLQWNIFIKLCVCVCEKLSNNADILNYGIHTKKSSGDFSSTAFKIWITFSLMLRLNIWVNIFP